MSRFLNAILIMYLWTSIGYRDPHHAGTGEISQVINPFYTNSQQIEAISQLGYGSIQAMTWIDSGLYVRTSAGIWKYQDPTNMHMKASPKALQNQYSGPIITEAFTDRNAGFVTQYNRGMVEVTAIDTSESYRLMAHSGTIISAAVNLSTRLLAVARSSLYPFEPLSGDDFDINVWDITSREERFTLQGHTAMITNLSYSTDGQLLASAGNDGTVRVWDTSNGKQIVEIQGHGPIIFGIDNTLIFTRPDQIIVYDLSSQQIIQSLNHPGRTLALASREQLLSAGDDKGFISLYDLRTMQVQATWNAHSAPITSIQWSPNGHFLASATQDELKIWDVTSSTLVDDFSGFTLPIHEVGWIDDTTVVSSESDYLSGKIRAWNPHTGDQIWNTSVGLGSKEIAVGMNGTLWINNFNSVTMFNQTNLSDRITFYNSSEIRAIALGPSDLAIASYNWIDLVNLVNQHKTLHLTGHKESINVLAFNTDGTLLASGSGIVPFDVMPPEIDYSVRLWDPATGDQVAILIGANSPVLSLAFSPDKRWLASGHADGTIQIWDIVSRTSNLSWVQSSAVEALAFHPDSTVLASGSQDNLINLWEVDTKQFLKTLHGNMAAITGLDFDADGEYLVSSSLDGTVRLWGLPNS